MTTVSQKRKHNEIGPETTNYWNKVERNIDIHRDRAKKYTDMRLQVSRAS